MDDPKRFFLKMNQDRKKTKHFCDLKLKCGDEYFDVHRCVLGFSSEYFERKLVSDLQEGSRSIQEVVGPVGNEIRSEILSEILEFLYTGNINLSSDNSYDILIAADYMDLKNLNKICLEYLSVNIAISSCFKTLSIAFRLNEGNLMKESYIFISQNLSSLYQTQSFKELDLSLLKRVVELKSGRIEHETIKYEAVESWINFDSEHRNNHLVHLLSFVDFNKIPLEDLSKLFFRTDGLTKICENGIDGFVQKLFERMREMQTQKTRLLKGEISKIWVCGGNRLNNFEFNVTNGTISKIDIDDSHTRQSGGFIDENSNSVYIVSNPKIKQIQLRKTEDGSHVIRYVDVVDLSVNRSRAAGACVDGCLYVVGGMGGTDLDVIYIGMYDEHKHQSIEVYNPSMNTVEIAGNLIRPRTNHAVVALNNKLYVLGGLCDMRATDSVECFDITNKTSTQVSSMQTCRSGLCAVAFDYYIVAIGGLDENYQCLKAVEIYNTKTDHWSFLKPMNRCRSGASACYANAKLYVFGGISTRVALEDYGIDENSIESYDVITTQWKIEVDDMDSSIFGHSLVVERKMENNSNTGISYEVASIQP